MTQGGRETVLQRKAAAARAGEPPPLTPERALIQGFARAAQEVLGLELRVTAVAEETVDQAALLATLEAPGLITVLEGVAGPAGVMLIDPPLLAAVIEMQTMGRLATNPPAPRKATRTDAAMAAVLIDSALAASYAVLAGTEGADLFAALTAGPHLEDPRPLALMLEDQPYRLFRLEATLTAVASRPGQALLAVPASAPVARRAPAVPAADPAGDSDDSDWGAALEQTVLGAEVVIDGVIHRWTMPIAQVLTLRPGMEIPLPQAALSEVRLVGVDGRGLGLGRLGQNRGLRALRIVAEGEAASVQIDGPGTAPRAARLAEAAVAGAAPRGTPPAPALSLPQDPEAAPGDFPPMASAV